MSMAANILIEIPLIVGLRGEIKARSKRRDQARSLMLHEPVDGRSTGQTLWGEKRIESQ
jgi:hypothetical protein